MPLCWSLWQFMLQVLLHRVLGWLWGAFSVEGTPGLSTSPIPSLEGGVRTGHASVWRMQRDRKPCEGCYNFEVLSIDVYMTMQTIMRIRPQCRSHSRATNKNMPANRSLTLVVDVMRVALNF